MFKYITERHILTIGTKTKIALSLIFLLLVILASFFIGSVKIPFYTVMEIMISQVPVLGGMFHFHFTSIQHEIVVLLREPQIFSALVIGASLGVGGAVIQSIFKNPITEPYVIGISSGAAFGAVATIVLGIDILGIYSIDLMAFVFSLVVVYLVYFLSFRHGKVPIVYLLLMGIAVSLFVSALVAFMVFSNVRLQGDVFFWLMGSLQQITWTELGIITAVNVLAIFVSIIYSRELDAIQLGEEYAHTVGVNVEFTKILLISVIAFGVSACVAVSGLIGFVGLVVPHVCRLIYGGTNRIVIPTSAIIGGIFLILSEDAAHAFISGEVIPIGIVTSLVGVPFFMLLLSRLSRGSYDA
jgi:iron complex transport system permease protein